MTDSAVRTVGQPQRSVRQPDIDPVSLILLSYSLERDSQDRFAHIQDVLSAGLHGRFAPHFLIDVEIERYFRQLTTVS